MTARYAKYKDSGVQWLGEIPSHWETRRAKYLFKREQRPIRPNDGVVTCFRDGEVTLRANRRTTGFTEATDFSHYQGIRKGDLVIHQMDAFAGSTGISDSDGMGTPVLSVCTPKVNNVKSEYFAKVIRMMGLNGFIQSLYRGIRERSSDFRFETFCAQQLPLPSLPEQEKIVAFLDGKTKQIDNFIAGKEHEIKLLDELKQAEIANAVTHGLNPNVKMKDSGIAWIGQIPEHWEVKRNKSFFYTTKEIVGEKSSNTQLLSLTTEGIKEKDITQSFGKTPESYDGYQLVNPNDIVLCLFDLDCSAVFSGRSDYFGMISPAYKVVKCKNGMLPEYAELWFKYIFQDRKYKQFSTSLRYTLTFAEFGFISILVPPLNEQREIVDYINHRCDTINKLAAELNAEIAYLKEYKQRLIADAVTGQIKVC